MVALYENWLGDTRYCHLNPPKEFDLYLIIYAVQQNSCIWVRIQNSLCCGLAFMQLYQPWGDSSLESKGYSTVVCVSSFHKFCYLIFAICEQILASHFDANISKAPCKNSKLHLLKMCFFSSLALVP